MTKKKMAGVILSLLQARELDEQMFGHSRKEAHSDALGVAGLSTEQYNELFEYVKGEKK